jgi:hypothetical protein
VQEVPGRIGNALQFVGGQRSLVTVPSSPSLGLEGPLTLALWVKASSFEGAPGLLEKWDSDKGTFLNGYFLRLNSRGQTNFIIPDPTGSGDVVSSKTIPLETWSSIAGVYDGSTMRIYINGAPDRTNPAPKSPRSSSAPLVIGRAGGGGGHYFAGSIDDVRVYSRALSAAEIARLAQGK